MIIQNGTIEFKTREAAAIDPETGYRQKTAAVTWGEPVPCQFNALTFNQLARVQGEAFTEAKYEIFIEEDSPTPTEQLRLKRLDGTEVGEFSVIQVEPLEAVCEKRILV